MIIAFCVLSCLLCVGLLVGIFQLNKFDHPVRPSIQYLFAAAVFPIVFNALSLVTGEWAATLLHGLYFAATDWLVIFLYNYAKHFTDTLEEHKSVKWIMVAGTVADTISMIVNVGTHHVFKCVEVEVIGYEKCFVVEPGVLVSGLSIYTLHLLLVYGMVCVVLVTFLMKLAHTVRLYRAKFMALIWSFIVILAVNIGYRFVNIQIDLSPILYSVLAVASAYFTLFYVPKGIVVKLLSLSVEDMENGILCYDKDGKCVYANEKSRMLFDAWDSPAPLEQYFSEWREARKDKEFKEESWRETRTIDGEPHFFETQFKFLLDNRGNYVGCFFSMMDRTDDYQKMEIERYKATHDNLTDIYNREYFFERVEELIRREPECPRLIVCIDVKDFKVINDLFGEETGDRILKRIAGLMRRDAAEDTIYGRLEADKFALCMREERLIPENYTIYLDELKKIVNTSVYRMHVHVGVYHIPKTPQKVSIMCDRAFMAIRSIKDSYQQIIAYYSDNMGSSVQKEKVMVGEFDRAIRAGEFRMFLQPQVSADKHTVLGAEALVRWEHPVKGMVSPGEFIPIFEKSGYITKLDRYVWELACRQLRQWKDMGREDLHISVNISPKDFHFIDIYDTFTGLVEQYGIRPGNLKLEITETAFMQELTKQLDLLNKLRDYGFHVEIDDFGSGYSSLNTLKDIEVDVLKLDMGFLRQTSHEDRSRTIVNAIINMSKNLGLTVITEGVETMEQVQYLTGAGCDVFQGYYFAKPMPVNEFEQKYEITASA
ncbi:MAG: EAL domain-containing protein [Clostridium sp.]|nr:EAL domain-containing protein [Acetatifactor muris]MCM1527383.1 EAL domain-containing protein [Bacteroides sp.]MCM1563553.1 EAL domain-containing protein [Clostridium sp.]